MKGDRLSVGTALEDFLGCIREVNEMVTHCTKLLEKIQLRKDIKLKKGAGARSQ